jgi:hypothetical protein
MPKVDLKKEFKHLYQPSAKDVARVEVPAFQFLMLDGQGDPNTSPEYAQAVQALFAVAYAAKFMLKKAAQGIDYAVMPLEGLWWADDMAAFGANDRSQWKWTMMIMQPPFVDARVIQAARLQARKKTALAALDALRLEVFAEGPCAQILHIGPFSHEGAAIQRVHDFIGQQRAEPAGKHHEVYLSDIRKADPSRWKTIIRQPMK